jgi:hypothetical protein
MPCVSSKFSAIARELMADAPLCLAQDRGFAHPGSPDQNNAGWPFFWTVTSNINNRLNGLPRLIESNPERRWR